MNLYIEQNKEGEPPLIPASLYDVCRWFIKNYPEDVFDGSSRNIMSITIVKIRRECKKLLGFK